MKRENEGTNKKILNINEINSGDIEMKSAIIEDNYSYKDAAEVNSQAKS
jgi:hypothetical protein